MDMLDVGMLRIFLKERNIALNTGKFKIMIFKKNSKGKTGE